MRKRELMGLFKFLESQGYETDSLSKFIFNLKNENEELKSQLKGTTHCYDESEHTQLKQKNEELKEELQKANDTLDTHNELIEHLKKELAEKNIEYFKGAYDTYSKCCDQQQEFINYLEESIKIIIDGNPTNISEYTMGKFDTLKEILKKYKEIIGGKNE